MSLLVTSPTPSVPVHQWDPQVANDLVSLPATKAVVVTDRRGVALCTKLKGVSMPPLDEQELAIYALQQAAARLAAGELSVSVSICSEGTVIYAASSRAHAFILAQQDANIGQLLSYARRLLGAGGAA
jgi:hypothetical protein